MESGTPLSEKVEQSPRTNLGLAALGLLPHPNEVNGNKESGKKRQSQDLESRIEENGEPHVSHASPSYRDDFLPKGNSNQIANGSGKSNAKYGIRFSNEIICQEQT
ncbi:hypothetical protein Dimus_015462 [Dionaea muscipula]